MLAMKRILAAYCDYGNRLILRWQCSVPAAAYLHYGIRLRRGQNGLMPAVAVGRRYGHGDRLCGTEHLGRLLALAISPGATLTRETMLK